MTLNKKDQVNTGFTLQSTIEAGFVSKMHPPDFNIIRSTAIILQIGNG